MRMLKPSKLLQLLRPRWIDIALPPGSWGDGAGYEVLIGVDKLVVLQAQQDKEFYILFNQIYTAFILNRTTLMLITRKKYTLRHKNFYNIHKRRKTVHIEIYFLENRNFLGDEFILLAVEALYLVIFAV
jgi:hypothetical protein